MDDNPCRRFFLQPLADTQRLYEALRAVCVDGCRQKEVAARYGFSPDAFRQQVSRFRARCAAGQPPPFSPRRRAAARPTAAGQPRRPTTPPSPIAAP
jgi:hypothetical protein